MSCARATSPSVLPTPPTCSARRVSTSALTTRRCSSSAPRAGPPDSAWPRCTSAARAARRPRASRGTTSRHRLSGGGGAGQPARRTAATSCCRTSVVERSTSELAWQLTGRREPSTISRRWRRPTRSSSVSGRVGSGSATTRLLREMLQHRLRVEAPAAGARAASDRRAVVRRTRAGHRGHATRGRRGGLAPPGRLFVERGFPHVVTSERTALDNALSRVPTELLGESTDLAVCGAARMFYERRWPEMTHLLARARALLSPDGAEVRTERACCCSPPPWRGATATPRPRRRTRPRPWR